MNKNVIFATIAVFISQSIMDYVIHGKILSGIYSETAELWRPEAEMKMGLMSGITLLVAAGFRQKTLQKNIYRHDL